MLGSRQSGNLTYIPALAETLLPVVKLFNDIQVHEKTVPQSRSRVDVRGIDLCRESKFRERLEPKRSTTFSQTTSFAPHIAYIDALVDGCSVDSLVGSCDHVTGNSRSIHRAALAQ